MYKRQTVDDVVYLTRFEMLKTGVTDLSSVTGLYDVADLEVKGDGTYVIASGAQTFDAGSLAKAAFRVQIAGDIGKTIPTNIGGLSSVAAIEATLTSAGFTKGTDYIYVLEGATSGGRKIVSAVDWDGSSLSAYTDTQANRDLAAKFLKEGTLAHDLGSYATKDGDVFTVNVEGWLASKNLT